MNAGGTAEAGLWVFSARSGTLTAAWKGLIRRPDQASVIEPSIAW